MQKNERYLTGLGLTTDGCVEVDVRATVVLMRNSKDPDGPTLTFTRQEWREFLAGIRNGEFDPSSEVSS